MKRSDFLKTFLGIPLIPIIIKQEQTDVEISNDLIKKMRKDGVSVYSKVDPPNWINTGEWRKIENSVQYRQIDKNEYSPTYGETRWMYIPFIKDPRLVVLK